MAKYECIKCSFGTSGVVNDISSEDRWCPVCRSLLMRCPHCLMFVSITKNKDDILQCDSCKQTIKINSQQQQTNPAS